MNVRLREYSAQYGLKFTLEESPAESAARRLAKTDMVYYPQYARGIVKGSHEDDSIYYTNSVHLPADADVSLVERIRIQGLFHGLIESGAITHAFVGEERPTAASIFTLVKNTFFKTQSAQITISPEFSYCNDCRNEMKGIVEKCDRCGSSDIDGISRIVGYYSVINDWNKSKKGELLAREAGNYGVFSGMGKNPARPVDIMPPYKRSEESADVTMRTETESFAEGLCKDGACAL
jgi:ribonucleoside-triphosphate reductase